MYKIKSMTYIKREQVMATRLTCSHPKVEKIWEYGGGSMNPTDGRLYHFICLKIKDVDEPVQFKDDGENSSEKQAEEYLATLL